ncbi:Gfo/Idh/MocA family oxidoreductase [Nocardioides sp.]|uniref:Gfo/Idh/MocA family protein n=1 Tax=Nocardioides sp. TaxID=35761 RepID=UPI00261BF333|nr:Gfo/Idh/MocA family oxidoreductase [Nocardioides sp.]
MTTRWGVAGTGWMAEVFVADFAHVPEAEVVAIGSRSADRAREFAAEHGVAEGWTYDELVAADVDVVYVATPHPQHHALAIAAIEAGKPVLVEKSFTGSLADTREVVDLARARGVFCMEAMWTRFQPAMVAATSMVADGAIGDVIAVQADLGAFRDYDPEHRLFAPELGGGSILDLGVYPISLAQYFLGTPYAVTATGTRYPNGVDASAVIAMQYADGRGASVACALTTETPGRAVVWGTGGSIEIGPRFHHPTELVVRHNGGGMETLDFPVRGRGYSHEIDEVNRCLAAGLLESPTMPLADTVDVQWVMEEALAQVSR